MSNISSNFIDNNSSNNVIASNFSENIQKVKQGNPDNFKLEDNVIFLVDMKDGISQEFSAGILYNKKTSLQELRILKPKNFKNIENDLVFTLMSGPQIDLGVLRTGFGSSIQITISKDEINQALKSKSIYVKPLPGTLPLMPWKFRNIQAE